MIKLLTDKTGWTFAVPFGDTHLGKWSEEQQSLLTDQTVPLRVLPHIKAADWVLDIGANIGTHTVEYAKVVGQGGMVLAFEPTPVAFACLLVNTRDFPQVDARMQAVGFIDGLTEMNIDPLNCGGSHVASLTGNFVKQVTVDSLALNRCDFIKIDVEGFEGFVITGAMDTIAKFRPKIFVELNDGTLTRNGFTKSHVIEPLLKIGYRIEFLEPTHNLSMPQLDIFLMP